MNSRVCGVASLANGMTIGRGSRLASIAASPQQMSKLLFLDA